MSGPETKDDGGTRRMTVYLDGELFKRLKIEATLLDVSLTEITAVAIANYLDEHATDPSAYFDHSGDAPE